MDSILSQTYSDFEVILVNDGSTDDSLKICSDYHKRDDRVKVLSEKNGGASRARNNGIDNAAGEYILFVDADDYIPENHLQVLYENLISSGADISCGAVSYVPGPKLQRLPCVMNTQEFIQAICYRDGIGDYPFCKLYKKELLMEFVLKRALPARTLRFFTDCIKEQKQ